MPTYVLYDPSEGSHVDATTLITGARSIYEGDFDDDGTSGDDVVDGGVGNIFGLGGTDGTELAIGKVIQEHRQVQINIYILYLK